MAYTKSLKKRVRQNEKKHLRNKYIKSTMKTFIKKVIKAVEKKDYGNSLEALKEAIPFISKAASKGVIHKNKASRHISRLTKSVKSLTTKETTTQSATA